MSALILPLLFGLAAGKLTMVLGGDGQGVPWDGLWATAYLGPGPWLSLAPDVPSHPSQVYEALATIGVLGVHGGVLAAGLFLDAARARSCSGSPCGPWPVWPSRSRGATLPPSGRCPPTRCSRSRSRRGASRSSPW